MPGHDARFHAAAKRVARGEANLQDELARLPHDAARDLFKQHVADETPKAALRQQKLDAEKQAKEDAAKAREKAREDAKAQKAAEAQAAKDAKTKPTEGTPVTANAEVA